MVRTFEQNKQKNSGDGRGKIKKYNEMVPCDFMWRGVGPLFGARPQSRRRGSAKYGL